MLLPFSSQTSLFRYKIPFVLIAGFFEKPVNTYLKYNLSNSAEGPAHTTTKFNAKDRVQDSAVVAKRDLNYLVGLSLYQY